MVLWFLFFFKQKTAYEMRISDWSSDVCSSDLVVVAMVALASWCMDRHVHRHPMPLADLPCEAQRKFAPRLGRQLGGQCDFIFAGDGRVLARLCLLGGVPEHGPVTGPRRGVGRHNKGVMFDALLAGVIVDEAGALVRDFDTRTIGCRCRRLGKESTRLNSSH